MTRLLVIILFIPFFASAQPKYNSESRKLFNRATKEYNDGKITLALGLFEECVAADARHAEAYLNISTILYDRNQMGDALKNAQKAYSNNKFNPAIYAQLGKCYYQAMLYDSSAYFLEKAVEMGHDNQFVYIYAGKSYYEMTDYAKAISYFDKAIAANANNPVSYNSRGKSYFMRGEYDKAEADFEKALELNPQSVGLYSNLANCELENDKPDEALEHIKAGMEIADDDGKSRLLLLLGNYYHKIGNLELAMENFNKAYDLDRNNAQILNNQAAVYLDQDNYEAAIERCNLALEINPEMMEAYFNRGIANEMLRKVEDACSDWEQAFILGSEQAEIYLNSATCNE
ncbi:MAG: tetratricopeptide repeat protein [Crocinitomicaceae bacterium]|nr:tetratricopeptide repeat protein [Crocinitomicaceae bacterium]